jgi:hypothetical protein
MYLEVELRILYDNNHNILEASLENVERRLFVD